MKFAKDIEDKGLLKTICDLAIRCWIKLQAERLSEGESPNASILEEVPEMGKRNIVYRIQMPNGKIWVARLRDALRSREYFGDSPEKREIERKMLESELATMRFIKERTSIPVPTVFDFDLGYDNPLGTPYMFMEYMPGKPFPFPFDTPTRGEIKDEDLEKIHNQLVAFQAQLLNIGFDKIGQLYFDPVDQAKFMIGPIVDRNHRQYGPYTDSRRFLIERAEKVLEDELNRPESIVSTGDKGPDDVATARRHLEAAKILSEGNFNSGPFFLQHVDLQWRNILLDELCNIVGIIDWEWALVSPLESFPLFGFNYAARVRPWNAELIQKHEKIALQAFQKRLEEGDVKYNDVQLSTLVFDPEFSRRRDIANCLETYNTRRGRESGFKVLEKYLR